MALKFNIEPYYDDFETAGSDGLTPQEKYYQVLFRPGYAVQARELTQLQSILQNQVSQFGRHMFKDGSMVIPGGFTIQTIADYVRISASDVSDPQSVIGQTATGATTGIQGKVLHYEPDDGSDGIILYISYINSGTDKVTQTFAASETINLSGGNVLTAEALNHVGYGSVAVLERGVYFIKDRFVIVQQASIVLDKFGITPSYEIGLNIQESIVTPAEDTSINDNATGAPNYAAPGAHRYQIKTTLVKQYLGYDTYNNMTLLGRIENGVIAFQTRSSDYSVIEETLARRTFDESGNYAVRPFGVSLKEHTDVFTPGDEAKLLAAVEPSKAYVQGYEIETLSTILVDINKARDYTLFESASVPMLVGNYVVVNNVSGIPDTSTFSLVELRNATAGGGVIIGYARARSFEKDGSNYNVYLFDIQMNSGSSFESVRSLYTAGTPNFVGDIVLVGGNAVINNPRDNSMVFPLPFNRVRTLDSELNDQLPDDFNHVYFANKKFGAVAVSSNQAIFNTTGTTELFEPYDTDNWVLVVATQVGGSQASGYIVPITATNVSISGNSEQATISSLNSFGLADTDTVILMAGVKKTLIHKTKSITGAGGVPSAADNINVQSIIESGDIPLDKCDGYQLIKVYMSPDFATTATISHTDVTEYYDFDNGQRDNFYDVCRLKIKPNTAFVPTGRLLVQYDYFTHTAGDFFSVDSYNNIDDYNDVALTYEDIPTFTSNKHGVVELRSSVDFRPRMNNGGGGFGGTGSVTSLCPEPATTMSTDIQYYLNRIDKVYLDKEGHFGVVQGVSSLNPELPPDPDEAMVLYNLYLQAYTEGPNEVAVEIIDNKRYTMRDIGKLERRINKLEYYTALSMLEAETAQKQIQDSGTGLDRFKNGFLVDSFGSHRVGDVTSPDYRASIDRDKKTLRPPFTENNVRMKFNTAGSTNVVKKTDVVMLPYTEDLLIEQKAASGYLNVNPFEVFSWIGTLEMTPSTDEWKDTTRRPNVVVDQEGVYDALIGVIEETDALGTVWNEWTTNWTGSSASSSTSNGSSYTKTSGNYRITGYDITTTTVTTTTRNQSREGIETYVAPDTVLTNLGDRIVEINFVPYMRSRRVQFKASRLKPNTRFYPYFDGQDVASYVKAITESEYTYWSDSTGTAYLGQNDVTAHPDGSTALYSDANGNLFGEIWIPNNSSLHFPTGTREFHITDSTVSPTTYASTRYTARGLLQTAENVTLSTRIPTVETREVQEGRVLENTSSAKTTRFKETSRVAQSYSSPSSSSSDSYNWYNFTPKPSYSYIGPGSSTFNSYYTPSYSIYDCWGDPLAQSFMISNLQGGGFITSVDLFFHTKSQTIPVTIQIREMTNGYPSPRVLTFSETTLPAYEDGTVTVAAGNVTGTGTFFTKLRVGQTIQIGAPGSYQEVTVATITDDTTMTVSETTVSASGVVWSQVVVYDSGVENPDPTMATSFNFVAPIYLQENTEYAITVIAQSTDYQVWYAGVGEDSYPDEVRITKNPYAGVLFLSQNAQTWTPDQNKDLKFRIRRAFFDTGVTGTLLIANADTELVQLKKDPIETTSGSNQIRIYHRNHGFFNPNNAIDSYVTISGLTAAVNGIPFAEINGTHIIDKVEQDSYWITVTTNATGSGIAGGSTVIASQQAPFNTFHPVIQQLTFPGTSTSWGVKTSTGASLADSTTSPYVVDTAFSPIIVGQNYNVSRMGVVASSDNNSGNPTFLMQCTIDTQRNNLSPVVDLERASVITVQNRIDYSGVVYEGVTVTGGAGSGATFRIANGGDSYYLEAIESGGSSYAVSNTLTILGTQVGGASPANDITITVDAVSSGVITEASITSGTAPATVGKNTVHDFISEIHPSGGTAMSKYVSKKVVLNEPSTTLKVFLDVNRPSNTFVDMYVKTGITEEEVAASAWTKVTPDSAIPYSDNPSNYTEIEYTVDPTSLYTVYQLKIVLQSTNASQVPTCRALRTIALA